MVKNNFALELSGALLVIVLFMVTMYGNLVNAGFQLKDDWTATAIVGDVDMPELIEPIDAGYDGFFTYAFKNEVAVGRFRPVYWAMFTLDALLFYPHPGTWYLVELIRGVVVSLIFWLTLRKLGFDWIPSTLSVISIPLVGSAMWMDLPIVEEPGFFFLAIATFSLVQSAHTKSVRWNYIALLTLIASNWCKEPFILLMPALMVFRVVVEHHFDEEKTIWQIIRAYPIFWTLAILIGAGQLGIVVYLYTRGGYGASVVSGVAGVNRFSPMRWFEMLYPFRHHFAYFIPATGILLYVWQAIKLSKIRLYLLIGAVIAILWIIPQVILYAPAGLNRHYFLPLASFFVFMTALGIQAIKSYLPMIIYLAFITFTVFAFLYRIPPGMSVVNRFVAMTNANTEWIQTTRDAIDSDDETILLITEPWRNFPLAFTYLLLDGAEYTPDFYWQSVNDSRFSEEQIVLDGGRIARYMPFYDPSLSEQITIVATMQFVDGGIPEGFSGNWQVYDIVTEYRTVNFSLRQLRFILDDKNYHFQVFVRETE